MGLPWSDLSVESHWEIMSLQLSTTDTMAVRSPFMRRPLSTVSHSCWVMVKLTKDEEGDGYGR